MKVLSINAGSSSLKFRLYNMPYEELVIKGTFEKIGLKDSFYTIRINGVKKEVNIAINNHKDAVELLIKLLLDLKVVNSLEEIEAIGHRVVHGGNKYSRSVEITDKVIQDIEAISDLAPLHNPAALKGIYAFKECIPNAKMVACFDTAFHQTMSEATYLYPVPYEWYVKYDVRKYGFHGLSHKFITEKMMEILGKKPNLIICHIGNGGSVTAVGGGKCVDTSMGFTPNAGIMMGTRSGDIDYSIINYILKKEERNIEWMDNQLNKCSGLEGITGMSDLRDIDRAFESQDGKVVLAIEMYTSRIAEYIARYYIKLAGKVDAIVFTAGGGENDSIIRRETLKRVEPLGIYTDLDRNNKMIVRNGLEGIISTDESKIPVYVLATDEELMIARDTYRLAE